MDSELTIDRMIGQAKISIKKILKAQENQEVNL